MPVSSGLIEMIVWALAILVIILILLYHFLSIPKRITEKKSEKKGR